VRPRELSGFTFLLLATAAAAQEPSSTFRPISEFHHTAWTSEQGAPGDTYTLAQTPDGWLWLGGPNGLFRFDGVQFERVAVKGPNPEQSVAVFSLLAEESGELWVGHIYEGVSRLKKDSAQHWGTSEGLPAATITAIARDAQGVVWAATLYRGLFRFDGTRWHPAGPESGFTDAGAMSMSLDGRGTFWIAGAEYLFRLRKDQQRFERTPLKSNGNAGFLKSIDGRMWYDDTAAIHLLPDQDASQPRSLHENAWGGNTSLFDRYGAVWSVQGAAQRHPLPKDATELLYEHSNAPRFTKKDGLTSDRVHVMLEDMEGNIWVATANGLDRFRHTNVHRIGMPNAPDVGDDGSVMPIAAGSDGAVWIGVNHGSLGAAEPDQGLWKYDRQLTQVSREMGAINAAERDANGAVWVGGAQGVFRQELGNHFVKLPALPAEARDREIHAIVVDGAGDPWVTVVQSGFFRLRNGTWQANGNLAVLPTTRSDVQARDPAGRIWIGYRDGRIAVVRDDTVSWYGTPDGLQLGMIAAIHVNQFAVVAGERAVSILHAGRFHTLKAREEPAALEGVTGIAQARNGDLWMSGAQGAVRIAAADLQEALRTERYTVTPEVFDSQDGFPGVALRVRPVPTLIQGTDDRLWFSGTLGLGWLDPQRIRRNPNPPPVHIRSVISDGTAYSNAAEVRVPQGTQSLQVSYTAPSLSRPERVRFRYRLDGYDREWIDAGTRRTAFYTNLPPGDYHFRVIAANDSGVWNDAGASVNITLPPTFVQTKLFLALCVLAGLAVMWFAYMLRIRRVTARERGRLEERLGERERIARELHDTLLQGVQGLFLQLQAEVNRPAMPDEARRRMNDALDHADDMLRQGRDRVKDLRSATPAPKGLRQDLLTAAEPMSGEHRAQLRVIESGTPRELHPIVREEAVRIAIEATINAFRHAEARAIEVEVSYEPRQLRIHVRDDGRGMEESVVRAGRAGHFGLMGMQERTKRIRGEIRIWSRPGLGTEVNLTVPASMAYVRQRRTWRETIASLLRR
jgi:signal transduction histidine kinase/ligand-binding sensor domain-containing protein